MIDDRPPPSHQLGQAHERHSIGTTATDHQIGGGTYELARNVRAHVRQLAVTFDELSRLAEHGARTDPKLRMLIRDKREKRDGAALRGQSPIERGCLHEAITRERLEEEINHALAAKPEPQHCVSRRARLVAAYTRMTLPYQVLLACGNAALE